MQSSSEILVELVFLLVLSAKGLLRELSLVWDSLPAEDRIPAPRIEAR